MVQYKLKRELGLFDVTVAGIGIILGAGIYVLIGVAAGDAGNATWLAFLISAIVAGFTGFSYAELTSVFEGDAGEYDYVRKGYGKKLAWIVAMVVIFTGLVSGATVALGFAGYIANIIHIDFLTAAIIIILAMSFINYYGIRESSRFNIVATGIEFLGLLIIIALGIPHWGEVNLLEMPNGPQGLFQAGALVFFAFMGFETIVKFREETINPNKTIPRALLLSIFITAIVYVLVSISAVSIVSAEKLATSSSPLAEVAQASLGPMAFVGLAIIALFSTSNTILLSLLTTSRMMYGMAKRKSLPAILSKVHPARRTPHIAVLVTMILAVLFSFLRNIELVANMTTVLLFLTFILVNVSAIILRYKLKKERTFKMPLNIGKFPVLSLLGAITSAIMGGFSVYNLYIIFSIA